ncbi:MAG: hypothetical protein JXB49_19440 [Bacteroidales bacterium]|nr:hypothetical protein [Bacteroidales bacterium]
MKIILKIISFAGLATAFLPSLFVLHGKITMKEHFVLMIIGTIMWFATSPFWMKSKSLEEEE